MPHKRRPSKRTRRSIMARERFKKKYISELENVNNSSIIETDSGDDPILDESNDDIFNRLLTENRENKCSNANDSGCKESDGPQSDTDSGSELELSLKPLVIEKHNEPESFILKGRRIVDMNHIFKQLMLIASHPMKCTMGKYKLQKECRTGLYSIWTYYCDNCEKEFCITSLPENEKDDINDALAWGAMSVGIGYSQVEEMFSVIDVPVMCQDKFRKHEKKVGDVWEETLVEKMKINAKEEKRIAIEKNHIFRGLPYITVIGDGGWAKRSYGHGMNSSSGVAVIIGAETKKLLFLGVRNKFCYACANPKKKNEHICYKNYNGSSTAMESSVIVDGFRRSEDDYGLIYRYYIGDGDSSVYARIQENCPYGRYVQKIECANHVTRALNDNLHKISENTQFPLASRQLLSKPADGETISRLERIVKGVRTMIKETGVSRSAEDISNLRKSIKNAPDHVFGNHKMCGTFCKKKDLGEENVLPKIDPNMILRIRALVGNLESKAESLIYNQTTNVAEKFMGCVAKFTGGKRVNFSSKGSYQRRCIGAGLAHSTGSDWHLSPWKKFKNKSPGSIFKAKILKRERRNFKRKLLFAENPPKRKRQKRGGHDSEYGPLAIKADLDEEELKVKCTKFIEELSKDIKNGNEQLQIDTIGQHTNQLWKEKRMNRLTASRFGAVAKRLAHTPCHNIVKSILIQRPLYTEAVTFGRDNEDHVTRLYREKTLKEVKKCGLFVDKTHPFLAASPDGLIDDDGLIEVKCLFSVKEDTLINEINKNKNICLENKEGQLRLKRSHNYFYQIQGQLNIAERNWCDFVVYTKTGELFIVLPKLVKFYLDCILPEIVDSRMVRGMRIKDSSSILEAQDKKHKKEKKHE